MAIAAALLSSCSADARVPRSLSELPPDQYEIEGMAGTKVVSMPRAVPCSEDPRVIVGVRFKTSVKRLPYTRALSTDPNGRTLSVRRFKNSKRWQFGTLRLTRGCGTLHQVDYSFHRPGDRAGQRLGNHVCVLGPNDEPCSIPPEG